MVSGRHFLFCFVIFLFCVSTLAGSGNRDHQIEAEDYFSIGTISDVAVSPNGSFVVYAENRWEPEADGRNRDLWIYDMANRGVKRLTFDAANDHNPKWSPDSRSIYFLSNRKRGAETEAPYDGKTQVWQVSTKGGQPFPITRIKGGIRVFDLSTDGKNLFFTTQKSSNQGPWADLKNQYDHLKYGHDSGEKTQLWALDLEAWKAKNLYAGERYIRDFRVSEDGSRVAMITTPDKQLVSHEGWSRVDVVDVDTGVIHIVTPEGWRDGHPSKFGWLQGGVWSRDSGALAFSVSFDGYPTQLYLVTIDEKSSHLHRLPIDDLVHVSDGANLKWQKSTRGLCFLGTQHARQRVYRVTEIGGETTWRIESLTQGDVVISDFSFDDSGSQLVVALADTTHPADLVQVQTPSKYRRLTHINPQIDTWKLPQIKEVTWKAPDGTQVHGILELPPDYDGDQPLPMVVELHGGPTSASLLQFRFWIYGRALLAAKGYAVLSPNYRGSTGYGSKFMKDLVGNENDIEVKDILAGVDAMVDRGIADPKRIGVMGWSNGGYLTNCLIAKSNRFKAASSGAGILSMLLQWSAEDTPGHVVNFMQGLPWEQVQAYTDASPVYQLNRIQTPTLIHVGGDDARCPPVHSKGLYRALRHYLDIPTELVIYPDEGHTLTTYKNRKAKMEWDLAWFETYLLGHTGEGISQNQ